MLVDFWTYTCINWLRTLPYVRAWAQKYKQGLVVIGVHTPEFGFEQTSTTSVARCSQMRIDYPSRSTTTTRSGARSTTTTGRRSTSSTRGAGFGTITSARASTSESEKVIQRLLAEAGAAGGAAGVVSVDARGVEAAADWANLRSPENYLGYGRTENFASPGGLGGPASRL